MTTTTDIARCHGHTGPIACQDCGTTELLHFGSWFDPSTKESGDFLQCCTCGIKAGDPAYIHDGCAPDVDEVEEPVTEEPEIHVRHDPRGWVLPDYTDLHPCTSNHHRAQDGRPPCTAIAVWRVVEDHDGETSLVLSLSFWCDADLPDEYRPQEGAAA